MITLASVNSLSPSLSLSLAEVLCIFDSTAFPESAAAAAAASGQLCKPDCARAPDRVCLPRSLVSRYMPPTYPVNIRQQQPQQQQHSALISSHLPHTYTHQPRHKNMYTKSPRHAGTESDYIPLELLDYTRSCISRSRRACVCAVRACASGRLNETLPPRLAISARAPRSHARGESCNSSRDKALQPRERERERERETERERGKVSSAACIWIYIWTCLGARA